MGWHPFAKQALREKQLDAELQFHLEQRIADNLASGMTAEEARRRALMEFSTLERVKEECRDLHWETAAEGLYRDLGYTVRTPREGPSLHSARRVGPGSGHRLRHRDFQRFLRGHPQHVRLQECG
jgi:hypothetical protein